MEVGNLVTIKAGLPYTDAMQGHVFQVVRVNNKRRFNIGIQAVDHDLPATLTFEEKNLEIVELI